MTGTDLERFDLREPRDPRIPPGGVIEPDREPEIAARIDRYLGALADGDLREAARQAVAIETDPPPVGDLLAAFSSAVVENDVPQVRTLRWRLRRRYETRRPIERARRTRANLWGNANEGDPEGVKSLRAFAEYVTETTGLREELLAAAVPIRTVPIERARRKRLRNLSARLAQRERHLAGAGDEVMALVADADLPPSVAILDASQDEEAAPGESTTVSVVVANVGEAPATGVTVSATTETLPVDPRSVDVGSIAPTTRVDVELSVTPPDSGHHRIDLAAASDDAGGGNESVMVWADDAIASIPAAYDRNDDGLLNTDEIQQALADFQRDEPIPGTEQTLDSETLRKLLAMWALDQPV